MTARASGGLAPLQRRFVLIETLIPSLANGIMPGLGMWLLGPGDAVPLWGVDGAARAMVLPTLFPALIIPIVVTLIVRMRVRKGHVAPIDPVVRQESIARFLPRPIWARALVGAVVPVIVMLPLALLAVQALGLDPMTRAQFIIFNVVCGVLTGLIVVPPVVIAALADIRTAPDE